MTLIKLSAADGEAVLAAARTLATSGPVKNSHEKACKTAKETIERELLRLRGVNVSALPEKEVVLVQCDGQDLLKVERKGAQKLDATALAAAHPELVSEFTRLSVASYFSSLL